MDHDPLPDAQTLLRARFGAALRLESVTALRDEGRNRVVRARLLDAAEGAPETVIVKSSVIENEGPSSDEREGPLWRLRSELAGCAFLASLPADPPLAPGFVAGDIDTRIVIEEDLGAEGASLADRLRGDDPAALDAAVLTYARSLGAMHRLSAGREAEFDALWQRHGGATRLGDRNADGIDERLSGFAPLLAALQVPATPGLDDDLAQIARTLQDPGPYLVFSPGDACPDNNRLTGDPTLRFFDFEFAGFGHALCDIAYVLLPFCSCWCVNRLPDALADRALAVYRAEFPGDDHFDARLVEALGYWTMATLSWDGASWLADDHLWGLATVRQRHPVRLSNFLRFAEPLGTLPALTETCRRVRDALERRFPNLEPMPLYPSLRGFGA
jgi:Ser/Thr protein kinase RdoA (MazF antagonist)